MFLQTLTSGKTFTSKSNALYFFHNKIWRVKKLLNQNKTRCKKFVSKTDVLENSNSKSDKLWVFFAEIWFSSCFWGSNWMMFSSVSVKSNLNQKREFNENVCYRLSSQMYNWNLPHVNLPRNVWGNALW